jgi:hypothetical protein
MERCKKASAAMYGSSQLAQSDLISHILNNRGINNMEDNQTVPITPNAAPLTPKQMLQNIEQVRDLFARSHDYIAQASHPGHLGMKVAEALNFLAFQYNDFKLRAENLAKQIEADAKAELSKVDVEAAKLATDAVLSAPVAPEVPKA